MNLANEINLYLNMTMRRSYASLCKIGNKQTDATSLFSNALSIEFLSKTRKFMTSSSTLNQCIGADLHHDIKNSIKSLCSYFPGKYWQKLENDNRYPSEFGC